MSHDNRVVTDSKLQKADWVNCRDVDLAKKWHVTRERVRQLRENNGGVECVKKHASSKRIALEKWVKSIPAERLLKLTAEQLWVKAPKKSGICKATAIAAFKSMGIQLAEPPLSAPQKALKLANWGLPNQILEAVWNLSDNWAGNSRCKNSLMKPEYGIGGRYGASTGEELKLLKTLVKAEVKKARGEGVKPNKSRLLEILNKLK